MGSWRGEVAFALAAAAMMTTTACGGTETTADQLRSMALHAGLGRTVGDFVALAASASASTYTATYPTIAADGTAEQITVTQRPPDHRIDVFAPNGTIESTIRTNGRSYQCSKSSTSSGSPWTCAALGDQPAAGGAAGLLDPSAVRDGIERLTERAAEYDFRLEERQIIGVTARCLVTTRKAGVTDPSVGGSGTLCLAPSTGAALLVDVPRGSLTASTYQAGVKADAFALPATPVPPPVPLASASKSS